jgi:sensor histidine kinase regulating citrate/malate metabolism
MDDGRTVQFSVTRDGDRLLEKEIAAFFRLGRMNTSGPSSIAMALVARIVDLLGGQVTAETPDQGGLRVTVSLPAFKKH